MKKHATIAIFIPHAGCPQQCIYCNQHTISGAAKQPEPVEIKTIIENAIISLDERLKPAQIAFFGGSFTAVDKSYMVDILKCTHSYIDNININSIRISTRPDAIDENTLSILKKYNVTDIELGAQSMCDSVLKANLRGHTSEDTANACKMIKRNGFRLGLQMMTGLYTEYTEDTIDTANSFLRLSPDYVRIYPTVILKGTYLEELYNQGEYTPQPLDDAVLLCSKLLELFSAHDIPVIRLGLHDSPELVNSIVAGPYHPAFRELCESGILIAKTMHILQNRHIPGGKINLFVAPGSTSKMIGQRRKNIKEIERLGYFPKIVEDENIAYLDVEVGIF